MFFDFMDKNKPFGNQFGFWKEDKKERKKTLFDFGMNEESTGTQGNFAEDSSEYIAFYGSETRKQ